MIYEADDPERIVGVVVVGVEDEPAIGGIPVSAELRGEEDVAFEARTWRVGDDPDVGLAAEQDELDEYALFRRNL